MSGRDPFPVVRVEIESLHFGVRQAIDGKSGELKAAASAAVEKHLTPEAIERQVNAIAGSMAAEAISRVVEHYFRYGAGQDTIREIAHKRLDTLFDI